MKLMLLIMMGITAMLSSCSKAEKTVLAAKEAKPGEKKLTLAAGCFWCVEEIYQEVPGVSEAVSGYSGGEEKNPTYKQVSMGQTGHTEAVEVSYDPNKVTLEQLLEIYWKSFDPTNGSGVAPDFGKQYRPVLFYRDAAEKKIMESSKAALSKKLGKKVAVEILPLDKFWVAEGYHQDYAKKNPNDPYVKGVSLPRLRRTLGK